MKVVEHDKAALVEFRHTEVGQVYRSRAGSGCVHLRTDEGRMVNLHTGRVWDPHETEQFQHLVSAELHVHGVKNG